VHAVLVAQRSDAVFPADPLGVRGKRKRSRPRHSEGDGKNMSCTHPHVSIVLPHINALMMRVFHKFRPAPDGASPASVPERGLFGARLRDRPRAQIEQRRHPRVARGHEQKELGAKPDKGCFEVLRIRPETLERSVPRLRCPYRSCDVFARSRPKTKPEGTSAQSLCCSGDRGRAAARRLLAWRHRREEGAK